MHKEQVLEHIIKGYRNAIYERYQYEAIKERYALPETIDANTVNQLREYFLEYMYPSYSKRSELNQAFESLDDYIKHPKQLTRILLDAVRLVFKYGRHLPKLLQAGIDALKSFRAATNFENKLVDEAIKSKLEAPYDLGKINTLLQQLSRDEIENFITQSQSLFEILHDKVLIKKIKEIIDYLILVMRKKEEVYTKAQIKGLEIGLELLVEGDALFNTLTKEDQLNLVHVIAKIERDHLDQIF